VATCGTFRVSGGTTEVLLNAAYDLDRFDSWVIAVHERGHVDDPPLVMSSRTV
jgi:hypothetical protein